MHVDEAHAGEDEVIEGGKDRVDLPVPRVDDNRCDALRVYLLDDLLLEIEAVDVPEIERRREVEAVARILVH
ncbi:MAG TPA: hypothetical protein VJ837_01890, partial [Candidatus Paceibacterota bacterium]|nr:hypothetical protein [Candidatus Paceibacterota bacterium]